MSEDTATGRPKVLGPTVAKEAAQRAAPFERRMEPVFTIAGSAEPVAPKISGNGGPMGRDVDIQLSAPITDEAMSLAARVRNVCRETGDSIMFTGLGLGHGATEVAAQIALAVSSMNLVNRLLVIDANHGAPLHKYFGVPSQPGLMDSFSENDSVFKHLRRLTAGLSVLPIGNTNDEAVNQLIARRGIDLFEALTHCHTLSIVNGPSFGTGPDMLLATRVTYTAVVAARGKVGPAELRRAKASIESVGAKFAGVILSRGS